ERLFLVYDRTDDVIADISSGNVRAHDRQLFRAFRELRERRAERHARKRRGNLARDAPNAIRSAHLRVECFKLRRSAELVKEDDRFARGNGVVPGGQGAGAEKLGQGQTAQTERADAQKRAAGIVGTAVEYG